MKLRLALSITALLTLASTANAELAPVMSCSIPTEPTLNIVIARDTGLGKSVAFITRDGHSAAVFEVPMSPVMTAANGTITATYAAHNFVLTLNAAGLTETDPVGIGFAAFQVGTNALSYEIACAPSAPSIQPSPAPTVVPPTVPATEHTADPLGAAPAESLAPVAATP